MATAPSSADRRRALAELVRERDAGRSTARSLRRVAAGLLLLALLALGGLWLAGFFHVDPEILALRGLVDAEIAELRRVARNESPLSSDASGFGTVLERVRDLPRELRREAGREVGRLFEARERAEMESYFNLPPERRQAELDRRIQAEEARRKAREAERSRRESERAERAGGPAGGGPGGGGPGGGGSAGGGGASPGRPRGGSATEDERNARSKARIDRSSPEQRAQRTEYRRAIDERRTQLGLPTSGGRR